MAQAGAVPSTALAVLCELFRDWTSPLADKAREVVVAPDGEIIAAGADGKVYLLSSAGEQRGAIEAAPTPIISLALSGSGERVAAARSQGGGDFHRAAQ